MPASLETFQKFLNPIFIETGSYFGDGIQLALDAGFQRVISIELAEQYFTRCKSRFAGNPKVTLVLGDSFLVLPKILKDIDQPVTFWLDGHYSGPGTGHGQFAAPLLQELEAIKQHHIKNHTILIDDLYSWRDPSWGFTLEDLKAKLLEINKDYVLSFEDYQEYRETILVAKL